MFRDSRSSLSGERLPNYVEEVRLTPLIPLFLLLPMIVMAPLILYLALSRPAVQPLLPGAVAIALILSLVYYLIRIYGKLRLEVFEGAIRIKFGRSELTIPAASVSAISLTRAGALSLWSGPQVWRGSLKFLLRGGAAVVFHLSRPQRDVAGEIRRVWVSTSNPDGLVAALIGAGFPPPSRPPEGDKYSL